jgi:vitamin B12 transporter
MILNNHLCLSRCFFWQYLGEVMNKTTNTLRRASALGLALTCASAELRAEEIAADATTSQDLVPYVVVATRTPLGLDRVSPSISYASAAEMEEWQDQSLVDTLSRQTGLVLKSNGGTGSLTSMFIRGTESNHTGFFMDGRRLNPGFGNQYDLGLLSVNGLSSVQVQRGASSVNYGSAGIGGVVDLQTQSTIGNEGYSVSTSAEAGAHDYARGTVGAKVSSEDWGLSVGGSTLTTDNARPNDAYDTSSVTSRADYKLAENLFFEVIGMYTHAEKEVPGSRSNPTSDDTQSNQNWLLSPGLRYLTDELSVNFFYSHSESVLKSDTEDYFGDFYKTKNEVSSDEVDLQVDYSITDDLLMSVGVQYRKDEAYNPNLNSYASYLPVDKYDNSAGQTGVWSQAQWILNQALELRGGVRYDNYTDYDDSWDGSLEAIYNFVDLNLSAFAKVATSYAPPSPLDLAYDENRDPDNNPSNTDLDPEKSVSYEFGLRQTFFDEAIEASVAYFYNDIDDLIVYEYNEVYVPFYDSWSDTYNVGKATTHGFECMLNYEVNAKVSLGLSYTYLTAEDEDTNERLVYRPRHLLQLSATYRPIDTVTLGVSGLGQFDRERNVWQQPNEDMEDFFVVDVFADWAVTDRLTLFGRIDNALDESYASTYDYPSLGATGYVGARLSF